MAMLGGVSEVAERLGISRQRFADLRVRNDFPEPIADLSVGPVWDLTDIDRWMSSGARRRPGRPNANERLVGGRFALEEPPLGEGGFAKVYRAIDRRTGEVVAVKVLKNVNAIDSEAVIRFRRELRIMETELDHPHVARILAHGNFTEADQIWCAMPLAVGSLQDEIREMANNLATVTDLARQLCIGVSHVHDHGVLHRDLKPGNILRSIDGLWQVSDFGLAREDERKSLALTSTLAQGMGTYVYASPEQWQQPKHADRRDDIYAIGKILQHAVTGQFPLGPAEQMPESALRPVIQRATGPRDNRYLSCADMLTAIEQATAAYSAEWEDPNDRLTRLSARLGSRDVDTVAANELIQWLTSDDIDAQIDAAARALVSTSREAIQFMWLSNPGAFKAGFNHFVEWMSATGFPYEYCDDIADTTSVVIAVTGDNAILRGGVAGLSRLGAAHSRWHVRGVLVEVLQTIRDQERAVVALEGLQNVSADEVAWSISEFGARSLHLVLRDGITMIRHRATNLAAS